MARRRIQDIFIILILCVFPIGLTKDVDDITTIYRFNEIVTDDTFTNHTHVESLNKWNVSSGFTWTYNSMLDVPFPDEGYISLNPKADSMTDALPINTTNTFVVSCNGSKFNIYLMSSKDAQLGNLIVVRVDNYKAEVLTCNSGKIGRHFKLHGITGYRRCQHESYFKYHNNTVAEISALYFEPDRTLASRNGFLLHLPTNYYDMKYISMISVDQPGTFSFRKPARVLALTESTSYLSYTLSSESRLTCLSLYYYMDRKCGGEISLYYKGENKTLLGKLFSQHQMGSWQIHRFVISWQQYVNGGLEIHAKKSSNNPLLIHSLQNCDKIDPWDSTTYTKPGNIDIHARTTALGYPFYLFNGSIVGPNVDIDVPPCPNRDENCEWILNNWSRVEKYTAEMETAPLPLWHTETRSLIADGSMLSEFYPFSGNLNLNFSVEIIGYNSKELKLFISEHTQFSDGLLLCIMITKNVVEVFERHPGYYSNGHQIISIPGHGDIYFFPVCRTENEFYFTEGNGYQITVEIIKDQVTVVAEDQATRKLECTGKSNNYDYTKTKYYFSLASEEIRVEVPLLKRVNYMLNLEREEGTITSSLILPTTDELCVSLLYYKTKGTLTLSAELLNGSRVHLDDFDNTLDWKYLRIVRRLGRQPLRLLLEGRISESDGRKTEFVGWIDDYEVTVETPTSSEEGELGKIMVQRIAGCHPEEDIADLGQEQNLQVINPTLVKNVKLSSVTNLCKNGGFLHEHDHCVCPPGFTGIYCERACGSDRFGDDCNGHCSNTRRECKGMILCKSNWGCSCAAGYKGFFCSQDCEDGQYGADCHQTCGNCAAGGCDSFTGMCLEGCQAGYNPPMCQEKCSYFGQAPVVHRRNGKISIELSAPIWGNGSPLYYQIQYKEEVNSPWLTIYSAPMIDKMPSGTVNITEPSSKDSYFIRAVIINEDACSYQGDTVPFVELTTNCKIPDPKMYRLTAADIGENNFTLVWQPPRDDGNWCEVSYYEVFIKEGWKWALYDTTTSSSLNINERSPGVSYQVKLRVVMAHGEFTGFSESLEVKTNVLSPAAVLNFNIASSDATQLALKWDYAYTVKHFLITYQCIKLLGCPSEPCDHSKGHYQSHDTYATLRDLLPLAHYTVKIMAFSGTYGPSSKVQALTLPAGSQATPNEANQPIKDRTNTSFTVQWAPPSNCSKLNGFQQGYKFRIAREKTTLLDGSTLQTSASFTNLIPHTQYEVDVFVVTNGGWDENYPLTISVSTRATTPERVANLTAYKRSRREIGLRWAPPAQTYGALQSFTISYVERTVPMKPLSKVISPTLCSAWPKFYCFTVRKLRPNIEYSLSIQARNVEVPEDGDSSSVLAKTQECAPTAPSYIEMINKDSTSLTIKWGIPWLLNGILRSFLLSVEEVDSFNSSACCQYFPTREIPVNTEESFYQIEISELRPASSYTVSVSAKTVSFGPATNLRAHTKPPAPTIPSEPQLMTDAGSTVGEISVKLTPVSEYQELVRGYLLLLVPEDPEAIPEPTIWDNILAQDIKTAINQSFYIVGEYSQEQLTGDGVVHILDQGKRQSIGILSELSQFHLFSEDSYKLIVVAVLEYEGAYNFSFKESDTFTAPVS